MQPRTGAGLAGLRRLVAERPAVHDDAVTPPGAWRGDAVSLWPSPALRGVDPSEHWIRLSTGADTLYLRAHYWAPSDRSRYLVLRLEDVDGGVRPVPLGHLRLADAVGALRPREPRTPKPSPTAPCTPRAPSLAAEVTATAATAALLMGAASAAAWVAIGAVAGLTGF